MRTLLLNLIFFLFLSSFFYSCEEPDPPIAKFTVTQKDSLGNVYVQFFDNSTNGPNNWEWGFEGGFPKTSNEQNPIIVYKEPGIFDVTLVASNEGGSNNIIKNDYINVARFINDMPTDAEVTFDNQKKILPARSSMHFLIFDNKTATCHVETSGKSIDGEQTGLLIYWDLTADLNNYYYYAFGLPSELVFFSITNSSNYNFTHFHANVNNLDYESLEQVVIPSDGRNHEVGYYMASEKMEVRAYFAEGYVSWIEGSSFDLPWIDNQCVDLNFSKSNKTINSNKSYFTIIPPVNNYKKSQDYSSDRSMHRYLTPSIK